MRGNIVIKTNLVFCLLLAITFYAFPAFADVLEKPFRHSTFTVEKPVKVSYAVETWAEEDSQIIISEAKGSSGDSSEEGGCNAGVNSLLSGFGALLGIFIKRVSWRNSLYRKYI